MYEWACLIVYAEVRTCHTYFGGSCFKVKIMMFQQDTGSRINNFKTITMKYRCMVLYKNSSNHKQKTTQVFNLEWGLGFISWTFWQNIFRQYVCKEYLYFRVNFLNSYTCHQVDTPTLKAPKWGILGWGAKRWPSFHSSVEILPLQCRNLKSWGVLQRISKECPRLTGYGIGYAKSH